MVRAAMIGAGLTLILIVIPVVHFITIWFASFIGGFVAGSRVAATDSDALAIGGLMSLVLAGPIVGILLILTAVFDFGSQAALFAGGALTLYVGGLGTLGAAVGGAAARRQSRPNS